MDCWELTLQGEMIVLELSDGVRTISRTMTADEAEELVQALTELVIECDLDGITGPYEDDSSGDDEDEAA